MEFSKELGAATTASLKQLALKQLENGLSPPSGGQGPYIRLFMERVPRQKRQQPSCRWSIVSLLACLLLMAAGVTRATSGDAAPNPQPPSTGPQTPEVQRLEPGTLAGGVEVDRTGAANYSLPLRVTPGTAGMQPALALHYNHRAGNGMIGVGWQLQGLSAITRCAKNLRIDGVRGGVTYKNTDRFCLGGERLVAIRRGTYGGDGTEYRIRVESEDLRKVISYGSVGGGPQKFKVWNKAGLIMEFGYTQDSRIEIQGKFTVGSWLLNKVSDRAGNYWKVSYTEDNTNGEAMPERIDYTGNSPTRPPYASVRFEYEERIDIKEGYLGGSKYQQSKRLKGLGVYLGNRKLWNYRFRYTQRRSSNQDGYYHNDELRLSLLQSIQECAGESTTKCQKVQLGWNPPAPERRYHVGWKTKTYGGSSDFQFPHALSSGQTRPLKQEGWVFMDIDGNGLADALKNDGTLSKVYLREYDTNNRPRWRESTTYALPRALTYLKDGKQHFYKDVSFMDLNGDGRLDLMYSRRMGTTANSTEIKEAYLNTGSGWKRSMVYTPPLPFSHWVSGGESESLGVVQLDVNGDGLVDLLYYKVIWNPSAHNSATKWSTVSRGAYLNTGNGWRASNHYKPPLPIQYSSGTPPGGGLSEMGVKWVDLNGDGRVDLLIHRESIDIGSSFRLPGNWSYGANEAYLNIGGKWKRTPSYRSPIVLDKSIPGNWAQNRGVQIIDINGDGLVDLLEYRVTKSSHPTGTIWWRTLSQRAYLNTGSGWAASNAYKPPVPMVDYDPGTGKVDDLGVRWMDLNGDGLVDILINRFTVGIPGQQLYDGRYSQNKAYLNTGTGWKSSDSYRSPILLNRSHRDKWALATEGQILDVNNDGLVDIVLSNWYRKHDSREYGLAWLNTGRGWATSVEYEPQFILTTSWAWGKGDSVEDAGESHLLDLNGDGQLDAFSSLYSSSGDSHSLVTTEYLNATKPPRLVSITGVLGAKTLIEYGHPTERLPMGLTLRSGLEKTELLVSRSSSSPSHGRAHLLQAMPSLSVVYSIKEMMDKGGRHLARYRELRYRYEDEGGVDLHGGGFHGFNSVHIYDRGAQTLLTRSYDDSAEAGGYLGERVSRWSGESYYPLSEVFTGYYTKLLFSDVLLKIPLYERSTTWSQGDHQQGSVEPLTRWVYYQHDLYGNRVLIKEAFFGGLWPSSEPYLRVGPDIFQRHSYENDEENWILGRLVRSEVSKKYNDGVTRYPPTISLDPLDPSWDGSCDPASPDDAPSSSDDSSDIEAPLCERRVSSFAYDDNTGFLKQEVVEPDKDALRLITDYTFDFFGNRIKVRARTGALNPASTDTVDERVSSYSYTDGRGRFLTFERDAEGYTSSRLYDEGLGVVLTSWSIAFLQNHYEYDWLGRLIKETLPDGNHVSYQRLLCPDAAPGGSAVSGSDSGPVLNCPATGRLAVITEKAGTPRKVAYYDHAGRGVRGEVMGFNGTAVYVDTEYGDDGRVVRRSLPYYAGQGELEWITYRYDWLGRVTAVSTPGSGTVSRRYDDVERTVQSTDAMGNVTSARYNSLGKTVETKDALGNSTSYAYDLHERLWKITDVSGNSIRYKYDLRSRVVEMQDPDLGRWSYEYDAWGDLLRVTDAKGQLRSYSYDALGRRIRRVDAAGTSTWSYYSPNDYYGGRGRLKLVTGSNGETRRFYYSNLGWLFGERLTYENHNYDTWYAHDQKGRLKSVRTPRNAHDYDGLTVKYVYNEHGYLYQLRRTEPAGLLWELLETTAAGSVKRVRYGNGVESRWSRDARELVTGLVSENSAGSRNVQDESYRYNLLGDLTRREDLTQGTPQENFSYDRLHRVVQSRRSFKSINSPITVVVGGTSLTYDALGNILSKGLRNYTYGEGTAGPHAVTRVNHRYQAGSKIYSYDANGNMVSGGGRTITWSPFNKPSRIVEGVVTVNWAYRAGREVLKYSDGTTTRISVNKYYAHESAGLEVRHLNYLRAGNLVIGIYKSKQRGEGSGAVITEETNYLHRDHLGSVVRITGATGAVLEKLSYDLHGKRRTSNWVNTAERLRSTYTHLGYTGHRQVDKLGLIHMGNRVYDPRLGRFLSADPFLQNVYNAQALNRYSYVLNNPLSRILPATSLRRSLEELGRPSRRWNWEGLQGAYQ